MLKKQTKQQAQQPLVAPGSETISSMRGIQLIVIKATGKTLTLNVAISEFGLSDVHDVWYNSTSVVLVRISIRL